MSYIKLPQQTQLTSRAALFQEDGLTGILSNSEELSNREVQRLHNVVRRSLGNFEVRPKRRKLDNVPMEVDLEATGIPFRLISWSLPPRLIHLVPVYRSSVRLQRPAEDTLDEAQLRQVRAQEAAVDPEQILTYTCTSNPKVIDTLVSGTNPAHLPSLLVAKPHPSANLPVPQGGEHKTEHSYVKCCPLVPLSDESLCDKTKRKRKRRYPVRDRTPPAFFRPMQEWGGKTAGYAMGWRGSRPVDQVKSRRYTRDNMRKGILGSLTR